MIEHPHNNRLEELTRWLTDGRLSRRGFIRQTAALGFSASAIAAILAACGGDDDDSDAAADEEEAINDVTSTSATSEDDELSSEAGSETEEEAGVATEPDDDGSNAGTETSSAGEEGTPKQGGEIIIGHLGEARTINPFLVNAVTGRFRAKMLFDQFIEMDPKTLEPQPKLAKEWQISDDAREFTFTLQDNVKFSDGNPMTMDDISFFIHGVLQPDTTSPYSALLIFIEGAEAYSQGQADSISGIEVADDKTLKITLTEPNVAFLVNLRHIRPVPKALLEGKNLKDDPFFQDPIGAGPFKFVSWQVGSDFVAERNEHYWQEGKPYLDRLTQRVIPDSQTLVLALETGEIDGSNYALPTVAESLQDIDTLKVMVPPFGTPDGWAFDHDHEALSKKEVRKAIALSMDMERFVQDFMQGLGGVGVGPVAPGNWAFNEHLKPLPYDPERAKELMAEAGYPDGGFSIECTTNQGNILREDFLTFTQASLQPLGITVESNLTEWSQVVDSATQGTFEAICPTWAYAELDPDELYYTLHSGQPQNVYNYSNPEVDELLEQGRVAVDLEGRKEVYFRLQEILMDDVPIFWAWYRPYIHVTKTKFGGYTDSLIDLFWYLEDWYVRDE